MMTGTHSQSIVLVSNAATVPQASVLKCKLNESASKAKNVWP